MKNHAGGRGMLWTAAPYGLGAFICSALSVLLLRPVAFCMGLVHHPDARKRHAEPTPAIGCLAIFAAVLFFGLFVHPMTRRFLGLGLAALIVVTAGVVDDHRPLGWRQRMISQALAGLILATVAELRVTDLGAIVGVPVHLPTTASTLLTIIATVGAINAVNMIDGIDGLAGAMSLATLVMLTGLAVFADDQYLTTSLAVTVCAVAGFLVFNIRWPGTRHASAFLGNAGAEFLGLLLVAACLRLTQEPSHPLQPKVAPFLLAPALIDCLTVIARRLRRGDSPFVAGRDHLHHVLLDAGLSVNCVVALVTAATIVIGGIALFGAWLRFPDVTFTLVLLGLWAIYAFGAPKLRVAPIPATPKREAPGNGQVRRGA